MAPICVRVRIVGERMDVDFAGTGPAVAGNLNAPRAVVQAAVIYVLRLLLRQPLPLNEGLLHAVTIRSPRPHIRFKRMDFTESAKVPGFVRGDCNADGNFNIADPIFLLNELFSMGDPAHCDDACDMNDDGLKDIGDPVYGLSAQFTDGPPPPAPHPSCGSDPTADMLGCGSFAGCP